MADEEIDFQRAGGLQRFAALCVLIGGTVHAYLWFDGYRDIPRIGALFALEFVVCSLLGACLFVIRSRLLAAAGIVFEVMTVGAFATAITIGLFGFTEVDIRGPEIVAASAEGIAILTLLPTILSRGAEDGDEGPPSVT